MRPRIRRKTGPGTTGTPEQSWNGCPGGRVWIETKLKTVLKTVFRFVAAVIVLMSAPVALGAAEDGSGEARRSEESRPAEWQEPNKALAEMYIRQAVQIFREGNLEHAKKWMDKSRSFAQGYSDPPLFDALYYLENRGQRSFREIRTFLDQARDRNRWVAFSAEDLYLPESRTAYRLGEYETLQKQGEELPHSIRNNETWYYRYLRALYFLDEKEAARKCFEEALQVFPHTTQWYLPPLDAGVLTEDEREDWAREIRHGADLPKDQTRVYLMRLRKTEDAAFLSGLYRTKWGEDSFLRLYSFLYGDEGDSREQEGEIEFPKEIQSWQMAMDYYSRSGASKKREDWSGFFVMDRNGDGYTDGKVLVSGGDFRRISWDRDQDDRMEWVFLWDQPGNPSGAWYLGEKGLYQLEYREYPHGGKVYIYWGEDRERRFSILPAESAWPLLEGQAEGRLSRAASGIPRLQEGEWSPQITRLMERSFRVEDYRGDKKMRSWRVEAGEITAFYEDTLGDGRMDHILYIRDGKIIAGRRDVDQDGEYRVFEVYRDGRWIGVQYDQDGNGEPEYFEEWEGAHPRGWDRDGDGEIDILQLEIPFSSFRGWARFPLSAEEVYDWDYDVIETMQ